jgi:hypothetical protein
VKAKRLIQQFQTLENLYANLDEMVRCSSLVDA